MTGDPSTFYFDNVPENMIFYTAGYTPPDNAVISKFDYGVETTKVNLSGYLFDIIKKVGAFGLACCYDYSAGSEGNYNIKIYRTTDNGSTWAEVDAANPLFSSTYKARAIAIVDLNTAYILKADGFLKTVNGGTSWTFIASPTAKLLKDMTFKPASFDDQASMFLRIKEPPAPS